MRGYFRNPMRLLDIFIEPSSIANELDEPHSWILPWVIVTIGTMVIGLASRGFYFDAVTRAIPRGTPPEEAQQMLRSMNSTYLLGVSLSALLIPLKWFLGTCLLYISCVLFNLHTTGRKLFNLIAHCALILLLQDFVSYVAILLEHRYVGSSTFVPDFSFNLLFNPTDPIVRAAIGYFSLFNIWYAFALVFGLAAMLSISRRKAFLSSLPTLILPMLCVIGFGMLTVKR